MSGETDVSNLTAEESAELLKGSKFNFTIDMESQFYQINLLKLLLKWKWHLLVITMIAVIAAVIFSGPSFITPKFKSYAVVYPANIYPYSDENETEQMLQIFQSKDIMDNVIQKYNLGNHYDIDSLGKNYWSTLYNTYSSNVKITKTPNDAVNIEVMDTDPQMACDMVNGILDYYNVKVKQLHAEKFEEVVLLYERALLKRQQYMDSLKNELTILNKEYNLLDYASQSHEVAEGVLKTIDGGGALHVNNNEVNKLKKNLEEKGSELILLTSLISSEAGKYADLMQDYERAKINYDRDFTYINLLSAPYAADTKSYPVRSIILIITALAAFFASFIVILLIENYKGFIK